MHMKETFRCPVQLASFCVASKHLQRGSRSDVPTSDISGILDFWSSWPPRQLAPVVHTPGVAGSVGSPWRDAGMFVTRFFLLTTRWSFILLADRIWSRRVEVAGDDLDLPAHQGIEFDAVEKRVGLHVRSIFATQPLCWLPFQQRPNNRPRTFWQLGRYLQLPELDVVAQSLSVRMIKGWRSNKHRVQHHAQAVDVDGSAVPMTKKNLWSDEGHGPAEGLGPLQSNHSLLGEAEVSQQGVVFLGDHNVVGLQVSENYAALVQVNECQKDFCGVDPAQILFQRTFSHDEGL
mmetsp:Transcript_8248/g.22858  ORF Transcript_8248/g.22858 Transcript_8248/m.22858 type:complete len:290 (+) Transcript_8248:509-1378(+)